jgi:hypothetical protein
MRLICACFMLVAVVLVPFAAEADTVVRTLTGTSAHGNYVAFDVTIDFTATGGDFNAGTGTAVAGFTLENTSGLYPFQDPSVGNPILTGFMFNVPDGAIVCLSQALILAGSNIYSTGGRIDGENYPPGCYPIASDEDHVNWYELTKDEAAGYFGIFTNSLETLNGIKGGIVDPEVMEDCIQAGDIFSPIVVSGRIKYVVDLGCLDTSLDCASDFLELCSEIFGEMQQPSALGGKFQGVDGGGEESCFVADPCIPISVEEGSWGSIKAMYRD